MAIHSPMLRLNIIANTILYVFTQFHKEAFCNVLTLFIQSANTFH